MTSRNKPFRNNFCALKTQDEIAAVSNAMTTFSWTSVDQILAQGNFRLPTTWLLTKLQDKGKIFL